mmetsp:Transcript_18372/g.30640  ORF Transcript_18372/g.30640 Transcript_18372/m.30640 type:complete len:433 (-) Transcript_18372:1092-2390(-)
MNVVLCALFLFFGVAQSLIRDFHYRSTTAFIDAEIHAFGLAEGGLIDVKYNISSQNGIDDPSTSFLLFLVVLQDQYETWYSGRINRVNYKSDSYYEEVQKLCVMPSMFHKRLYASEGSFQYNVEGSDLYDVIIIQCFPQHEPLVADLTVHLSNPTSEGCCAGHLPIESVMSINIALAETVLYCIMLISYVGVLFFAEKEAILPMHYLLVVTVSISAASSLMDFIGNTVQNNHGHRSVEFSAMIYLFHFFETLSFKFTVLILGMGWSFVRQNIAMYEKGFIGGLFILFVGIGLGQVPCVGEDVDNMSPACQGLDLVQYVLAGLMLLSTIIALNYSVSQLRAIISNLNWNPSMPVLYARLKQYNQFRNLFLVLLVVPTVMYMVEITVLTWRQKWVGDLGQALVKMVFIFYTGAIFLPLENTLLNRSFNGSLNAH